jgi:hypothetical protein
MEVPPQLKDFKNFLFLAWKQLNLPDPTPLQYDIADYMQHGDKRAIVQAFRGCGKSWICSAYVVHQLLMDQSLNILVVSASKTRSDDFSTFTLRLIHEMEILHHLRPTDNQRQSKISFDVGGAPASHAPSVKSLGITSQLTGSRADIIVLDDVEVANNSATQMMREKLSEAVREVDAILKPLDSSRVLFLGTPQTEDSLYSKIQERGYKTKIWPACHVSQAENEKTYNGNIAPMCVSEKNKGRSTEPLRFSDIDLAERKISYGSAGFALQFQLDSTLADVDRFPLKISDLIVTTVDCDLAPEKYVWARSPDLEWDSSIPNVAFAGERYYRPFKILGDMVEYNGSVLAIDPAGRGTDETSYAVVKMLNGVLYVPAAGGLQGGYSEEVLEKLCHIAKDHKVNYVLTEQNFGGGMFGELLKPVLTRIYPVTLEEVRHSQQKEKRIVDTLEPVMSGHRLVIDPQVIQDDYKTVQHYPHEKQLQYSLFYQMSRMTRERGAIRHDDRLDALAMGVAYWTEQLAQDAEVKMAERKVELLDAELQKFQDSYFKNKTGGAGSLTW